MIKRKILAELEKELLSDKVIVLTGMRRVGKTTLVRYLYDQLSTGRKLFLDLENPLNQAYFQEVDYEKIKLYFERLAVGRGEKLTIFLDEIQNVKNLPSVVKYLYDHYQIKFVLTGSASFYLKNLFSESLAGRKRVFELFPLDFEEFLSYKAPNLKKPNLDEEITKPIFLLFDKYFWEYLTYGGFPSVVLKNSHEEKIAEIEDIFTSYFQKEIQLLSDFRKIEAMRATVLLLPLRVGSKIDLTKISSELGISRITLVEYLSFLEGTYFINRVRPYSQSLDISLRGMAKLYWGDNGFLTKTGTLPAILLENLVFNLLRQKGEVFFYQSKGGAEIDFLVKKENRLLAFEVKSQAHPSDVNKLEKLCRKLKLSKFFVVSQGFKPMPHVVYSFQL